MRWIIFKNGDLHLQYMEYLEKVIDFPLASDPTLQMLQMTYQRRFANNKVTERYKYLPIKVQIMDQKYPRVDLTFFRLVLRYVSGIANILR